MVDQRFRFTLVLLSALVVAFSARADSVTIDISPTGFQTRCGETTVSINRVCIAVTNDEQNEDEADNDACIESLYVAMTPETVCYGMVAGTTSGPPGWDPSTGDHRLFGRLVDQWIHWQNGTDAGCVAPDTSGATPFCFDYYGDPIPHRIRTDKSDTDGDGFEDTLSTIPTEPFTTLTDDNDTDFRTDTDGDGIPDEDETRSDPTLADSDEDGVDDAVDNCPGVHNPDQTDTDGDGLGDACDPFPENTDGDFDGVGDLEEVLRGTDPDHPDTDRDGVPDREEIRKGSDPTDPQSVPEKPEDAIDNDGFGVIDEQVDADLDGVDELFDNCQMVANPGQTDVDGDGEGDLCDLDDRLLLFTVMTPDAVAWQPDLFYPTTNLYRGSLQLLRDEGTYLQLPGTHPEAAWSCDLLDALAEDLFPPPPPGEVVIFLVSGNDTDDVEGGIGTTSAGDARLAVPSCHNP